MQKLLGFAFRQRMQKKQHTSVFTSTYELRTRTTKDFYGWQLCNSTPSSNLFCLVMSEKQILGIMRCTAKLRSRLVLLHLRVTFEENFKLRWNVNECKAVQCKLIFITNWIVGCWVRSFFECQHFCVHRRVNGRRFWLPHSYHSFLSLLHDVFPPRNVGQVSAYECEPFLWMV